MTLLDYNQCTPKEMGQRVEFLFEKEGKAEDKWNERERFTKRYLAL